MKLISKLGENKRDVMLNLAVCLVPALFIAMFISIILFGYGIMSFESGTILFTILCTVLLAALKPVALFRKLAKALNLRPMKNTPFFDCGQKYAREMAAYACDTVNNPAYHNMAGNIYNHQKSRY